MLMRSGGFTLIESMIGLAIVAVVLAAMAPDITEYMGNMRIRSVADQMRDGLMRAKTEAVKRNASVAFLPLGSGWSVVLPASGTVAALTLASRPALASEAVLAVTPSRSSVTFNGSGWVGDGTSFTADVRAAGGACRAGGGTIRCLRVSVTGAGDIAVCDPSQANTVNGCS
jgi:type IV fimbrial biogenesis protein FimT